MTGLPDDAKLDTCGCCEAEKVDAAIHNAPGLPALAYRIGTHSEFLRRLEVRLPKWVIPDGDHVLQRPLTGLTTRSGNDPAIALLDAWAVVGDVLTFYQERIANEGFLRTATERRSVLEMARSIGYELDPGVAASTYLVFTEDDAEALPDFAVIPAGTQVQSIPTGKDELPQTFETSEEFVAKVRWNELRPQSGRRLTTGDTSVLYLDGVDLNLDAGDMLLVVHTDASGAVQTPEAEHIRKATEDLERGYTKVELAASVTLTVASGAPGSAPTNGDSEALPFNELNVRNQVLNHQLTEAQLQVILTTHKWTETELIDLVDEVSEASKNPPTIQVYVMREAVGFFGNNAPTWLSLPISMRYSEPVTGGNDAAAYGTSWDTPTRTIWTNSQGTALPQLHGVDVLLEREVEELLSDTWVVFEGKAITFRPGVSGDRRAAATDIGDTGAIVEEAPPVETLPTVGSIKRIVYRINSVDTGSIADYAISAKSTGLTLTLPKGEPLPAIISRTQFHFRSTTAYVKSEQLELTDEPIFDDLHAGDTSIVLDRMVLGLQVDQPVVLTGELAKAKGVTRTEIKYISLVTHEEGLTTIKFTEALEADYVRESVTINANVVHATHGETVSGEVLGSGDGSQAFQTFTLKKPPLTFVSSANGSDSTLSVRIDRVEWELVPSLFALGPDSRRYTVRINDDVEPSVIFGDGEDGARLSTGQENVVATYRSGIGLAGNVGADSLTLLKTKPYGIRSVTNPRGASGGEDPEKLADARENAPVTVLTLERVVSLRDYEDYARSFPGIGKARADIVWTGEAEIVHVTIATADGKAVEDDLLDNLFNAIAARRDPLQGIKLESFDLLLFDVEARVLIDSSYGWDDVQPDIDTALRTAFSFAQRAFAQPVSAAEIIRVIHAVEGVVAVDLEQLMLTDDESDTETSLATVLQAERARFVVSETDSGELESVEILPAQLLLINTSGIELTEMQP